MKKILFSILLFFVVQSAFSQVSFGGGITYDLGDKFGFKALGAFEVDDSWDGFASFSYLFGDFAVDLDGHYRLIELGDYDNGSINPFVGLNIYRDNNVNGTGIEDTDLGINLGIHLNAEVEEYDIFLEPKISLGGIGGLVISAGIMF